MKKILILILIIIAQESSANNQSHPINIGCEILLDAKEDLSHISDSLKYFQNELSHLLFLNFFPYFLNLHSKFLAIH